MFSLDTTPFVHRSGYKGDHVWLHDVPNKSNMEGGGRGARIIICAVCSVFAALAVTISLYYLRDCKRNRKKGSNADILDSSMKDQGEKDSTSFTGKLELAEILKENGHGEFTKNTISSLLRMLERVQDHMLDKLLVALLNCSAFTRNQVKNCSSEKHQIR